MSKKKVDPVERFKRWHWGIEPTHQLDVSDDRYPDEMIEIGRLMELIVSRPTNNKSNPKKEEKVSIEVDQKSINECYVVFDNNHPKDRIYFILNEECLEGMREIYNDLPDEPEDLNLLANTVGGHHSDLNDYPMIYAKPIGYLTDLVYYTHKSGDDDGIGSGYIHAMGEEKGGIEPLIAVSEDGHIWMLGGTYTCPNAGITN